MSEEERKKERKKRDVNGIDGMLFIVKMGGGGDVCTCDGWESLPAKHTTTQASTHKSVASFLPSCHTSAHIPPILGESLLSVCM